MFRRMSHVFTAVGILAAVLCFSDTAVAQLSPPISPWMSMFQRRTGPLDNYNAAVKPQQDALRNYQAQQRGLQQNQQAIQSLQRQNSAPSIGGSGGIDLTSRAAGPLDPNKTLLQAPREVPSGQANAAYYNNLLNYYQPMGQSRVPNFSQPGANRRR